MGGGKKRARSLALLLALVYLGLIPTFAVVYVQLGHQSFYDSNAKVENGAINDASPLCVALTTALLSHLRDLRWNATFTKHIPLRLHPREIHVIGIEFTTAGRILLQVTGSYGSPGSSPLVSGTFGFWIEPNLRGYAPQIVRPSGAPERLVPVSLSLETGSALEDPKPIATNPPVSLIFPAPVDRSDASRKPASTNGTFAMSETTYQQLEDFYAAVDGDTSYASDDFSRMLYLSAATITTLGFGESS